MLGAGVLLYGPPGTGKTLMARACAAQTKSTFLKLAGPQLVQMFIGDGAKLVRDAFALAKEKAPAIIFIDELDAIGTKRFDSDKSGDREVQRTMLELLNQLDGFSSDLSVKVIAATNRIDILDPALLRSGRLDRKIEFPSPDRRQKRLIFSVLTGKMNLSEEVDLEDYVSRYLRFIVTPFLRVCVRLTTTHTTHTTHNTQHRPDKLSGAEINAICQEAGMQAVRKNRYVILPKDFEKGYKSVARGGGNEFLFYQ